MSKVSLEVKKVDKYVEFSTISCGHWFMDEGSKQYYIKLCDYGKMEYNVIKMPEGILDKFDSYEEVMPVDSVRIEIGVNWEE